MSADILQHVWDANSIRLIADGVPAGDLSVAKAQLKRWDDWYPFWAGRGDVYEQLAREALARGRKQSAGELFWQACLSYHYAQFLWFHDPKRRDAGQRRKVELYREAAPLFAMPAERFDVPFEQFAIPGYLRLPPHRRGRVPVAIILGGLESTKEESYRIENMFLTRGSQPAPSTGRGRGRCTSRPRCGPISIASARRCWIRYGGARRSTVTRWA
jgi:2,6-dihydroxypseudooxynicotine hydrolase